ncbi:Alginate O-acetyl transferase AlgF [Pigmentiphaga humi]|uniref:Alginate biosynthesis protein AlgF n=1 Tax=Pigmentiphaga humi TaxID=2478468 RepID=A0A3P4B311_9BURK|nr:alginate O-acetyltransferase AlgF [Pigmentiphaga humi]VCU70684.1 Alginate O-acetyl transferase AlgF [Pigmentiphaga humi]
MTRLTVAALAAALTAAAHAAEIPLYPTGPAEDSAFIRFVNAAASPLEVQPSGGNARLSLPDSKPASGFMAVAANKPVSGTLVRGGQRAPVSVNVKPGEFATVVAVEKGGPVVIKESPDDFNAMRVSLAFYNADQACANAALRTAGRNIGLFDAVAAGQSRRRLINPITLTVEITCGGQPQGAPLELGALEAGQRYTVIAVPAAKGTRALFAHDAVSP